MERACSGALNLDESNDPISHRGEVVSPQGTPGFDDLPAVFFEEVLNEKLSLCAEVAHAINCPLSLTPTDKACVRTLRRGLTGVG